MSRSLVVFLCATTVFFIAAPTQLPAQAPAQMTPFVIAPIRVPAGAILAFHLQTRLRQTATDPVDLLPHGTVLHVKLLSSIDSGVQRDGTGFQGSIVSDLVLGSSVVIHCDAKVQGLLALLRSRNHPDGFRYELLLTEVTDHGKSYPLTASLNSSFFDSSSQSAPTAKLETKQPP
ncbi:MAG: hypothetical protein ACRD51_06970, partial [Candidatus Acidiferrum sp.]